MDTIDQWINLMLNNVDLVIILTAVIATISIIVYKVIKMPRKKQIEAMQKWLLIAVIETEKELGSGTGKVKLSKVYDKFANTFPELSKIISFDTFSKYVDECLEEVEKLLENKDIYNIIYKSEFIPDLDKEEKSDIEK